MKKERVKYCDLLRFLAIISVIMIHINSYYRSYYLTSSPHFEMYFMISVIDCMTRIGVPIFFLLTGFFMLSKNQQESYFTFIKKKVIKLFFPFLIASFLYYVISIVINKSSISFISFLSCFTTDNIKYHLWFMYTILLMYLVLPFLKKLVQALSKKELETCILVLFISSCLALLSHISSIAWIPFFNGFLFPDFLLFSNYLLIGYYLYQYGIPKNYHRILYGLGICSFIITVIFHVALSYGRAPHRSFFLNSASPLIIIMTISFVTFVQTHYDKWKISKRVEKGIAKINPVIFFIYLFHVVVVDFVFYFFPEVFLPVSGIDFLWKFLISTFFIVICSFIVGIITYVLYQKVEKMFSSCN